MRRTEQNRAEIIQPPLYGYDRQEDEISLVDLWRVLVRRKGTIFVVAAIATIGAVLYAMLATPVYKAEAIFLPPAESDIQSLNIQVVQGVSVDSVYTTFKKHLGASTTRRAIFNKMKLFEQFASERDQDTNYDQIFSRLNENITTTIPKEKKGVKPIPTITLSMEGEDPLLIAEIVNHIAAEAERATTEEVVSDIQAKLGAIIDDLNREIQRLREQAKKQRLDEIARLKLADALERETIKDTIASLRKKARSERLAEIARLEEADRIERKAIEERIRTLRDSAGVRRLDRIVTIKEAAAIAHSLGIGDPIGFKLKKISDSYLNKPQILTDIIGNTSQLYMRGYEALEAEMASLSNRTSEDPFIPELRELQDQLKQLENNEKIVALKTRQSDDPFIPGFHEMQEKLKLLENNRKVEQLKGRQNDDPFIPSLRDKENELARLESVHIDPAMVRTARMDQAAHPPEQHIKPKRKLIVVLGMVLGLMLGVFSAFFVSLIKNQRKEQVA